MKKSGNVIFIIFTFGIFLLLSTALQAQKNTGKLVDFWPIGQELTYTIDTWGKVLGHSTCTFTGIVKHSVAGNCYLFQTETIVHDLKGDISSQIKSDLFTDVSGLPRFYTVDYVENGTTTTYQGYLGDYEFLFREVADSLVSEFSINYSPTAVLCDRQSVPQWNLAFFNEANLENESITFNVMIPYLKQRTMMKMERKPDETIPVLGKAVLCKVFYSIRTDENYYITPENLVARIHLPKQGLTYELTSILQTPGPETTEE